MEWLSRHDETVFVGQAVRVKGTAMHETLRDVSPEQLIEFPVAENLQLGACTGMALAGWVPICIFPRINFMLEAISQLVSHLDKIPLYSGYKPKVIIRTGIASPYPMNPGVQHLGDYSSAIDLMLSTVKVEYLYAESDIMPTYQRAWERDGSTLVIERLGFYDP